MGNRLAEEPVLASSSQSSLEEPAFLADAVSRRFGEVQALNKVEFSLRPGEIHALVGENGAGKSTLAKIIAGGLKPDMASMSLFGQPYAPESRRDGASSGVAYVRQQLSLVRGLTVAENLQLGRPGASPVFNLKAAIVEIDHWCRELSMEVPAESLVDDLPLALRQQAEILTAVAWGARLLILDEPSSSLGPRETAALISLCHRLRDEGTPIIYISHRLPELTELADRLTVLRQGEVVVGGADVSEADLHEIAEMMVGDISLLEVDRPNREYGETRLTVDSVAVHTSRGVGLENVSFQVRSGEVLGVVGVAGNGQNTLAETLTGQSQCVEGQVIVDGVEIAGKPRDAISARVAHLYEDRSVGLAAEMTVADNALARRVRDRDFSRYGIRLLSRIRSHASLLAERFQVRPPDPTSKAGSLSGGNQQKLMAVRELENNPAVLVAHGPTKGLDPEASKVMRDRCFGVAEAGGAVVVISADLEEIVELADRVIVLSAGKIVDRFDIADMTAARLGAAMAGLSSNE